MSDGFSSTRVWVLGAVAAALLVGGFYVLHHARQQAEEQAEEQARAAAIARIKAHHATRVGTPASAVTPVMKALPKRYPGKRITLLSWGPTVDCSDLLKQLEKTAPKTAEQFADGEKLYRLVISLEEENGSTERKDLICRSPVPEKGVEEMIFIDNKWKADYAGAGLELLEALINASAQP